MSYNDMTWRYFQSAPRAGTLQGGAGRGTGGSRDQGTWVQFELLAAGAGAIPRIEDARFLAFGCPHTIAVAAYVAERAIGTAAGRALPETIRELQARFEVPVEKLGRLLIVEDAWLEAVDAVLRSVPGPLG